MSKAKTKKVPVKATAKKAVRPVATKTGKRIIATFVPQVWVNDYAMEVDPEGEDTWDVTDEILAMPREKALALQDCDYESDALRELPSAPEWVRDWGGPFSVVVEDSIKEFFQGGAS